MAIHSFQLVAETINDQAAGRFGGLSETFTLGGQSYTVTHLFTHANGVQFRFSTNAQALAFIGAALTVDLGISGQSSFTTDVMDNRIDVAWAQYQAYPGRFVGGTTYSISISDGVSEDYEGGIDLSISIAADAVVEAPPAPVIPTGINLGRPVKGTANYIGAVSNVSALINPRFIVDGATAYLRTFYLTPGGSFLVWLDSTSSGNGLAPGPELIPAVETSPNAFLLSAEGHGSIPVPGPGIRGSGTPTGDHTEPYQYSPLNLASIRAWLGQVADDAAAPDVYLEITDIGAGYVATANMSIDFNADGTDLILTGFRTEDPVSLAIELSAVNTRFLTYGYVGDLQLSVEANADGTDFISYGYVGTLELSVDINSSNGGFTSYSLGNAETPLADALTLSVSIESDGSKFTSYTLGNSGGQALGSVDLFVDTSVDSSRFTSYTLGDLQGFATESIGLSLNIPEASGFSVSNPNVRLSERAEYSNIVQLYSFYNEDSTAGSPQRSGIGQLPRGSSQSMDLTPLADRRDRLNEATPDIVSDLSRPNGAIPWVHIGDRVRLKGNAPSFSERGGYGIEGEWKLYIYFENNANTTLQIGSFEVSISGRDTLTVDMASWDVSSYSTTSLVLELVSDPINRHGLVAALYSGVDGSHVGDAIQNVGSSPMLGDISLSGNAAWIGSDSSVSKIVGTDGRGYYCTYKDDAKFAYLSKPLIPLKADISRGRDSQRPLTPPRVPTMHFTLEDVKGWFYRNRPYKNGTPVSLISELSDGSTQLMFTGLVDVVGYKFVDDLYTYHVAGLGLSSQLISEKVYGNCESNLSIREAITRTLAVADWEDDDVVFDDGVFTFNLSDWWLAGETPWVVLQRLVATQGPPATFFEDHTGALHFRGVGLGDPDSARFVDVGYSTDPGSMVIPVIGDIVERSEVEYVVNHAEIEIVEYEEQEEHDTVWRRGTEFRILPGAVYELTANFSGPVCTYENTELPDFQATSDSLDVSFKTDEANNKFLNATRAVMVFDNSESSTVTRVRNVELQGTVLEIASRILISSDDIEDEGTVIGQSVIDSQNEHGLKEWSGRAYNTLSIEQGTQLVRNIVQNYHEGVDTFKLDLYGPDVARAKLLSTFDETTIFHNPVVSSSVPTNSRGGLLESFTDGRLPANRAYMRKFSHVWERGFYYVKVELESRSREFFGVAPFIIGSSTLSESRGYAA